MDDSRPEASTGFVDLHSHTTFSDGLLTPEQLIAHAKKRSLRALAITDHDTIEAVNSAVSAAQAQGMEIVPGVELSATEGNSDVHILGYYIYAAHDELLSHLATFRTGRFVRAQRMVSELNNLGMGITFDQVLEKAGGESGSIGRPHVAQVLVDGGHVKTLNEAFRKYIGSGRPAYVEKHKISASDAIGLIQSAGGIAVMAHPGSIRRDELIPELTASGLSGLEVFHPEHNETQRRYYGQLAQKHGLVITGGSDYHGPREGRADLGSLKIPYSVLSSMRQRWKSGN
ncbi:MAG: PHP domain-containing protein [Candidatus Latescibacteria bacterium]|nr:PHP domain-containing protein [Candidatus Latescibacterota bacterium]